MPDYTTNLNLAKPNATTEPNDTFNLDTYLNDNWDKLDTFSAKTMTTDNAVNNLAATQPGFYLDARQGAAIQTQLNNKADLLSTPQQTTSNITYYVDTTNGNDSNNGLTSGTAFKTIQYAINKIPKVINHTVNINVLSGTYSESVLIQGFTGYGLLNVIGGNSVNTTYNVSQIVAIDCNSQIVIKGFNLTTSSNHSIAFFRCKSVIVQLCNAVASTATYAGISADDNSSVKADSCAISNKAESMLATFNSTIFSSNNTGSSNAISLKASSGTIKIAGTIPSGTITTQTDSGGKIINNISSPNLSANGYRYNDDGTIEQWGSSTINSVSAGAMQAFNINFPTAFSSNVFALNVNCNGAAANDVYVNNTYAVGLTQLTSLIKNGTTQQNITINWHAIGK